MKRRLATLGFAALLVIPWLSPAADHRNLEEDNPITVEDAFVIAFRSIEQ